MIMKRLSTEDFIKKANKIHKNKYDYSKTEYINSRNKVCIICSQHGEFWQLANSHLQGQGCPECGKVLQGNKLRTNKKLLLEKFSLLYNNKYEYDLEMLTTLHDKIRIKCPKHGWFYQKAIHHLNKHECPLCKQKGKKYTTEEFIIRAKEVHGNTYDYSKVLYTGKENLIEIICYKHGSFWQKPHNHINGCGCPKCRVTKTQLKIFNILCSTFPDEVWLWEYSPHWLGNQRIDIYNPRINLAIEYNGEQHYMPVNTFGGKIGFEKTQLRDKQKIEKLNNHNCIIYIIPYYDFNIDNIIKQINQYLYESS